MKPVNTALVSVDEKVELAAQKVFYDKIEADMGKKQAKKLEFWRRVSLVYSPVSALVFVALYWVAGLKHANII